MPEMPWRIVSCSLWALSGLIQVGNSCLSRSTSNASRFFSLSMSCWFRLGGTITLGNRPLPLCRKMKRVGGVRPAGSPARAMARVGESNAAPAPRAVFFRKSLLVSMASSSRLFAVHEGVGGQQRDDHRFEAAAAGDVGLVGVDQGL